jgi:hypothetical protein
VNNEYSPLAGGGYLNTTNLGFADPLGERMSLRITVPLTAANKEEPTDIGIDDEVQPIAEISRDVTTGTSGNSAQLDWGMSVLSTCGLLC